MSTAVRAVVFIANRLDDHLVVPHSSHSKAHPPRKNRNIDKSGISKQQKCIRLSKVEAELTKTENTRLRGQSCCEFDSYAEIHENFFPFGETYQLEPDAMMVGVCKTAKSRICDCMDAAMFGSGSRSTDLSGLGSVREFDRTRSYSDETSGILVQWLH